MIMRFFDVVTGMAMGILMMMFIFNKEDGE